MDPDFNDTLKDLMADIKKSQEGLRQSLQESTRLLEHVKTVGGNPAAREKTPADSVHRAFAHATALDAFWSANPNGDELEEIDEAVMRAVDAVLALKPKQPARPDDAWQAAALATAADVYARAMKENKSHHVSLKEAIFAALPTDFDNDELSYLLDQAKEENARLKKELAEAKSGQSLVSERRAQLETLISQARTADGAHALTDILRNLPAPEKPEDG